MNQSQAVYNLASVLLQYPSREWKDYLPDLHSEADSLNDKQIAVSLKKFLDYLDSTAYADLCQNYVLTFDFNERSTLYLTYSVFKDNRERGPALVKLRQEFKEAGAELESDELPDYLPLILEFAAITEPEKSAKLLKLHFRSIERLSLELGALNSPYHFLLAACADCIKQLRASNAIGSSDERRII
ncbi:nitrate reductase molybdenum cofactor assembly chaperone [Cytobacillus sp. FSL H8-0458]|uniref:nitrate reductase molybdenum cofactor assembly chaperone n=1 Tax=Cytobacillus sp. FSL H8-0458 TaxID=2975346 RepID=UPI0030F98FA1